MTRPPAPTFDQRIADWLEDDPTFAPREVLSTVTAALPSIEQRRASRVPWRLPTMFNNRVAFAGLAAVLAVAIGGFALSRISVSGPGAPSPRPTTSPAIAATPSPNPSPTTPIRTLRQSDTGTLQAGTYRVDAFAVPMTLTLPGGYLVNGFKPHDLVLRNGDAFLAFVVLVSIYPDPCHTSGQPTPLDPGIDAAVTALSSMAGFTVEGLKDATIGGKPAKSFSLSNTIDIEADGCSDPQVLWIGRDGDDAPVLESPGGSDPLWLVDVDGTTVLIGGPEEDVRNVVFTGS